MKVIRKAKNVVKATAGLALSGAEAVSSGVITTAKVAGEGVKIVGSSVIATTELAIAGAGAGAELVGSGVVSTAKAAGSSVKFVGSKIILTGKNGGKIVVRGGRIGTNIALTSAIVIGKGALFSTKMIGRGAIVVGSGLKYTGEVLLGGSKVGVKIALVGTKVTTKGIILGLNGVQARTLLVLDSSISFIAEPKKIRHHSHLKPSSFPRRSGNRVTLYQDAHSHPFTPIINDDFLINTNFEPPNLFEDIYKAIVNAREFIYINGWSLNPHFTLIRRKPIFADEIDAKFDYRKSLGDILIEKAKEGVEVKIQLWNELLSINILGLIRTNGAMNTYDEIAKSYFDGTGVDCRLSYRNGTLFNNHLIFTHHQKSVTVDVPILQTPFSSEAQNSSDDGLFSNSQCFSNDNLNNNIDMNNINNNIIDINNMNYNNMNNIADNNYNANNVNDNINNMNNIIDNNNIINSGYNTDLNINNNMNNNNMNNINNINNNGYNTDINKINNNNMNNNISNTANNIIDNNGYYNTNINGNLNNINVNNTINIDQNNYMKNIIDNNNSDIINSGYNDAINAVNDNINYSLDNNTNNYKINNNANNIIDNNNTNYINNNVNKRVENNGYNNNTNINCNIDNNLENNTNNINDNNNGYYANNNNIIDNNNVGNNMNYNINNNVNNIIDKNINNAPFVNNNLNNVDGSSNILNIPNNSNNNNYNNYNNYYYNNNMYYDNYESESSLSDSNQGAYECNRAIHMIGDFEEGEFQYQDTDGNQILFNSEQDQEDTSEYGDNSEDLPEIEELPEARGPVLQFAMMTSQNQFQKIWSNDGYENEIPLTFFRPVIRHSMGSEKYYILGDIAERENSNQVSPLTQCFLVSEDRGDNEDIPLLQPPVDYELICSSPKTSLYIWKPIPPQDYVSLGCVATTTNEAPILPTLRCVHISEVDLAFVTWEYDDKPLWSNIDFERYSESKEENEKELVSLWSLTPKEKSRGLVPGTFEAFAGEVVLNQYYCFKSPKRPIDNIYDIEEEYSDASSTVSMNTAKRRVIAFVGGLDLTSGRWDDQTHTIYRTEDFSEDFYMNWKNASIIRQPWHDVHCKLEGPAARDVLMNFKQRWNKQCSKKELRAMHSPFIIPIQDEMITNLAENEWNCQILRSIDHLSATIEELENSIQFQYIERIRSAQRFIYIENQFFMGSCRWWKKVRGRSFNLIPHELSQRVVRAIHAGVRFAIYIVLPLHPEGHPETSTVSDQLAWQWNTMKMMYKTIVKALKETNSTAHPFDYLNFYCLGYRKMPNIPFECKEKSTKYDKKLEQSKRFMIYVHSKMMVIDDESIILGSANINDRSMAGNRDTELAIDAFQPFHTGDNPRGGIFNFRMSLWAEHTSLSLPAYLNPSSLECVQSLNEIAELNWNSFASEKFQEMAGHLMKYPVIFNEKNRIVPNCEYFPDTKGHIDGSESFTIPGLMTS